MPDENQQPNNKPIAPDTGQVIQPTSSDPKPESPQQAQNPTPAIEPTIQPTAVVNGQPFAQFTPVPVSPIEQKPSKWRYFFIALGILQASGVAIFLLVMLWAAQQSKAGVSGMEFIGLILFVSLVPAVGLAAFINLIGLPIYMLKQRPKGKGLALCVVSLVISGLLASYAMYSLYSIYTVPKNFAEDMEKQQEKMDQQLIDDNKEITKEEAIELLNTCKIEQFYYTNQNKPEDSAIKSNVQLPNAESSKSGVVLVKIDGKPYRLRIADRLVSEMVPIARAAQTKCGKPYFWHDGAFEKFKDGKWYFNDQVVYDANPGNTKEEAIRFMQGCKADYFVGYTDITLVKDSNTKAWLDKAEKSTTGIAISESAPKSYVFASKSMTAELEPIARQFRQACYSTKKLYITVDNWIETEYPQGKWTRVSR